MTKICLIVLCCILGCGKSTSQSGENHIRLHPQNGRYFEFRGKPTVLVGSTEQYGSLMNLDFDFIRYLDEIRACGLNLTRAFTGTYRHYPGFAFDTYAPEDTPLAVPLGRFIAPWARSNVPGESDGGNKFDLTQWDPAYFHRLHQFVKAANDRGIVVEITLFCPFYSEFTWINDDLWNISPMNNDNHINGVGAGSATDCFSVNSDLLPYQKALVRKFAEELQSYDNIYFEIANEGYYGVQPGWEDVIVDELVAAETLLPKRHLIARNFGNYEGVISNPNPAVSIYNFHYAYPTAASANDNLNRVIGNDETGFEGIGDLAYREEAWQFMLSGGALENHLDFSFSTTREDGMASQKQQGGGGPAIRRQLGIMRWFLEELPLIRCIRQPNFISSGIPSGGSVYVLGSPGEAYGLYLRGGTQANLVTNLPAGTYQGRWIDPRSGAVTATVAQFTHVSGTRTFASPAYVEDAALMLFGGTTPPPEVMLTSPVYQTVAGSDAQITLTAQASVTNGSIDRVEFLGNDGILGTDTSAPYSLTLNSLSAGKWCLRARVVAVDGRTAMSEPVKCHVVGAYHSGVNLNGNAVSLNGNNWTASSTAITAGTVLGNFNNLTASPTPLYPVASAPVQDLLTGRIVRNLNTEEMTVDYPLANGTYDVFLCLAEGSVGFSRDTKVRLETAVVAEGIGNLAANEWVNYGPYRTTITDGVLNIGLRGTTKGNPIIANFSVYAAETPVSLADAELDVTMTPGLALVSWPPSVPAANIQTSTDLGITDTWETLTSPAADLDGRMEAAVPITGESKQFFRIRKD